jgi:hypothetical protein
MKTMLRKLKSKAEEELQTALLRAFKWISEKDFQTTSNTVDMSQFKIKML